MVPQAHSLTSLSFPHPPMALEEHCGESAAGSAGDL